MGDGVYHQAIRGAEGMLTPASFPSERYTCEMTREELAEYYEQLRVRLAHAIGHREYHRGRRGAALR